MNEDINNFINSRKAEILSVLEKIVNMDSASDYKKGADVTGDFLSQKFLEIGLEIEKVPQKYYGNHIVFRLKGKGDNTLIIGHFDTALPQGSPELRPFKIIGNKGYGCGVADMKAGIIATLYALKSILETTKLKPNITIILNSDEEPGSPTSREIILKEAPKATRAFIMEPGRDNSIITRRKGVGIFTFSTKGVAAHAGAEPEKGCNAIVELGHMILALSRLNDHKRGITVNVGVIEGGTYPYVVAEEATAKVDCRIPTKKDGEYLKAKFDEIVKVNKVKGVKRSWQGDFHRPPMEKIENTSKLLKIINNIAEELRIPVKEASSGGASDGNLSSSKGVVTIDGMGPVGAGFHGTEEYVEIDSIFERTKLLAQTLFEIYNS